MPAAINSKRIDIAEHDAIIAALTASRCDVEAVAARFNRGVHTIKRFASMARARGAHS